MGYEYLVAVEKGFDSYLLVDSRNDSLCFDGSRAEFEAHDYFNYVTTEMFDEADEFGSTDFRMNWENSTYITARGQAITRENLISLLDTLDDNLGYTAESKPFLIPAQGTSVFGGVNYPDLIIGAAAVGIDRDTLDAFINQMVTDGRRTYMSYSFANAEGVFRAARDFAGDDNTATLGWAAVFSNAMSVGDTFRNLASKPNGRFILNFLTDLRGMDWNPLFDIFAALNTREDRIHDYYEFNTYTDLAVEDGYAIEDVRDLIVAGHRGARTLGKLLKNDIDAELASKLIA